jgi:hypothetical protein
VFQNWGNGETVAKSQRKRIEKQRRYGLILPRALEDVYPINLKPHWKLGHGRITAVGAANGLIEKNVMWLIFS